MSIKKAKTINMTSGPIFSEMLRFALPLFATYLIDIAFNAADRFVAGQCAGSNALAAVSACAPVTSLLVGFFNGLAIGATVVIARHIGAKNKDATEKAVHTAAAMGGVFSLVLLTLGMLLADGLLRLLDTPQDIFADSITYFRIRICGVALDVAYKFCAGALRASGETKKPLIFSTCAGVLNLGLNFLLVAGFRMGVAGLAIATDISSLTTLVCALFFMFRTDGPCRIYLRKIRIHWDALWQILRIGLPSSIQTSCFNVSNAMIQRSINLLGTSAVAGCAASVTYINIVGNAVQAIEHTCTTWASQNFGAKQLGRIKSVVFSTIAVAAVLILPFTAAYAVFAKPLLAVFVKQTDAHFSEILYYGSIRMYMIGCFSFLHALMNTGSGTLRGIQKPWLPMISAITGSVILRVLWLTFVFPIHPTAMTVFICYPITWTLTAIFNFCALTYMLKKYKKTPPLLPTT